MSHFAQVKNGIVQQVIVAEQDYIDTLPDKEDWVQTSYNNNIRGVFAGIGYTYDVVNDVFVPPPEE